jgi:hypothetical protein
MKKVMVVGCGAYMDSGYGCPGEWRCLKAATLGEGSFDEQIGHQEFSIFGAHVTPFFGQNHGDISQVLETGEFFKDPEGLASFVIRQARNPGLAITAMWRMLHQVP